MTFAIVKQQKFDYFMNFQKLQLDNKTSEALGIEKNSCYYVTRF